MTIAFGKASFSPFPGESNLKVAMAQFNPIVGDLPGNAGKMRAVAADAQASGAELLVFPELAVTGYPPRDLLERSEFIDSQRRVVEQLATELAIPFVTGFVDYDARSGRRYNAAAFCNNGTIHAIHRKVLLPTYDVFDETRYFSPGADEATTFELGGLRFGILICEDTWCCAAPEISGRYEAHPVQRAKDAGCQWVINLAASPYSSLKQTVRMDLFQTISEDFGMGVVFVNQVGGNDELIFDGSSVVVSTDSRLQAQLPRFETATCVHDLTRTDGIHGSPMSPEAEVHGALCLGLRDYVQKCGFSSVILGLSGGIDSAVVAALACDALGPDKVHCVAMPSTFSSEGSVTDARALAENLGVHFQILPIAPIYDTYLDTLQEAFEETAFGIAEENLQARARGNLVMALSNKFGHLVLTTGNKSELAVGYCTLYGDMSGGLSVLSDLNKTGVYALARWINQEAGTDRIPVSIIDKPPSAELRPGQKDSDSLPPYDVLDEILDLYVTHGHDPAQIVSAGYDALVVDRLVTLFERSEYKRRQAAPGLKISPRAFGVGWRMPVAGRWHRRMDRME
jgi:NAD+ synthetase